MQNKTQIDQKMKKIHKVALVATILLLSKSSFSQTYVPGHMKKDGTYIEGYYRTSPNSRKSDNYSTEGNYNPYTGSKGYKKNTDYDYNYESPKPRRKSKNSYY